MSHRKVRLTCATLSPVLWLWAVLMLFPLDAGAQLQNGDMEGGFTGNVANGWTSFVTNGSPVFTDGTDRVHGGSHAQKIDYPQPSGEAFAGIYQVVSCQPGQNGTLSAWKNDHLNGGDPWAFICRLGYDLSGGTNPQAGSVVWSEFNATPHDTWIQKQVSFTTTGSSVTVFVEAWHKGYNGTHTAWFDDITLSGVGGGGPTNTPTPTPDPGAGPYVTNGDFEGGFDGSGVANGWSSWIDMNYSEASFADGTDYYQSPSHSQKFNAMQPSNAPKTMGIYQQVATSIGGTYNFSLKIRTDISQESYGCENMEVHLGLDPYGTANKSSLDVEWHQLSCTRDQWINESYNVTAQSTSVTVWIEVKRKWNAGGWGYVWIDDVDVTGPPPGPTYTPTNTVTPTATLPPPVGPELVSNGGFESWSGGSNTAADNWSSWSTAGTGYWKRSTLVGKSGGGTYANPPGWYQDFVAMRAKTYLLGAGYGAADSLESEPGLEDSIVIGRYVLPDSWVEQIYYGDYQQVAQWLTDLYVAEAGYHPRVDAWCGQNEPDWTANWQRVIDFEIYFTQLMHAQGLQTVVLNMAVGTPGDMQRILDCKNLFEICDYYGHHVYGGPADQLMVLPYDEGWNQEDPYLYALRVRNYAQMYKDRGWRFPPVIYTEGTTYGGWHSGWPTSGQVRDDIIHMIPYMNEDRWCTGLCIFDNGGSGAWEEWDVTGYGICGPVGSANQLDPADKTDGLYSQQFGVGDMHCRVGGCNRDGVFTGGIVQLVNGLSTGETHLLGFDFKWEHANGTAALTFEYGLDWTGQTSNPNAGSINWSGDLITLHDLPHQIFQYHSAMFTAQAGSVSVWFRMSQNLASVPVRINLDAVSLRQVSGTPEDTPTPAPTSTFTPVPTNTPVDTPTNTPTDTPTNTPIPTNTPTSTDTPVPVDFALEAGTVSSVGTSWVSVGFVNDGFVDPVVVCAPEYAGNSIPYVVRVRNVSATGFQVRIQNPSDSGLNAAEVHFLAVEKGTWTMPDGRKIEAQTYTSTVTDENNSWGGQVQSYGQTYTNPVVLGQVMTANDGDWSVFWACSGSTGNPPTSSGLKTGKTVCEDTDVTRSSETVGFIVIEQGGGVIEGVPYEVRLGVDTVRGVVDGAPFNYTFNQAFGVTPMVGVVACAGMDGGNGGWPVLYGASPLSKTQIALAYDEDQIGDSERNHTTEQVAYAVFQWPVIVGGSTTIPTPTNTPTNTFTPTNTPTNTFTPTNTPTNTFTPTNTPVNTATPTPTDTPSGPIAAEDFETMPSWSSTYDASWGSAATWTITSGGQSGNYLRATRSSGGSSARVIVYTVPQNTDIRVSGYMRCPSSGTGYWAEFAYKLGNHSAENFDQDAGTWTLIKKFDSYGGQNGNGDTWVQYSLELNTGSNTQISIGYKLGSSGGSGPAVGWDTFRIEEVQLFGMSPGGLPRKLGWIQPDPPVRARG